MRILIVDDDAISLEILENALVKAGYDVVTASDGAEDGKRKIGQALRHASVPKEIPVVAIFAAAELELALGREHVIHAALAPGPATEGFLARWRRLIRFRMNDAGETAFIDPGKPWQNGTDESFNGKFRDECLTIEWFRNRLEAQVGIERWRRHYNEERPHMSLGDRTPAEFKSQIKSQSGWLEEARTGAVLQ